MRTLFQVYDGAVCAESAPACDSESTASAPHANPRVMARYKRFFIAPSNRCVGSNARRGAPGSHLRPSGAARPGVVLATASSLDARSLKSAALYFEICLRRLVQKGP